MEINEAIKLLEKSNIMGVTIDKSPLPLAEAVRTVIDALKEQQPRVKEQWNMCIEEDEDAPKEAGWYRVIDANGNEYADYFFAEPRMTPRGVSYWKDSDYPIIAWKHASAVKNIRFILNGCDISFVAEAPEDITLYELLKQCDKIKPDWCACGIKTLDFEFETEIFIGYNNIRKANDGVACKIVEGEVNEGE